MDRDLLIEFAPELLQACVPLARAGADHYFTSRQMEKRRAHEIDLAERRQEGLQQMSAMSTGAAVGQQAARPGGGHTDDVYERLDRMHQQTECGFCRQAISALKDQPRPVARQGAAELQQYMGKAEELRQASASTEEVERVMNEMTDQWEVIPDVMAGQV